MVSFEWKLSLLGEFVSLAFRDTQCSLTLEYETGRVRRVRLCIDTQGAYFPIDRLPEGSGSGVSVLWEGGGPCVRRIKFDAGARSMMEDFITVRMAGHAIVNP